MTWPNVNVSQINRFNGTTTDVERVVLYVGYGTTNVGKTQALNTGSDLDKALGDNASLLKSLVAAAANNAGQNWFAFVHVLAAPDVGMQTNKVYIGWTGTKVKIQVDASDMGEVYTTKFPPPQRDSYTKTESDGRYIYRDTSTTVGFVSGNANDPYIRHSTTNGVVVLPTREQLQNEISGTRNWANNDLRNDIYAYGDNRYVYDVQRGSQALENGSFVAQADWEAPTGCFMTGIKNRVDLGDARTMGKYYRALMVRTASGGWRQVGN